MTERINQNQNSCRLIFISIIFVIFILNFTMFIAQTLALKLVEL